MIRIDIIAGARPNFMKIGPIIHAIEAHNKSTSGNIIFRLIHTGQHYDKRMSGAFFEQLNIPNPQINLGVGSGSQAFQTGEMMVRYEKILNESEKPNLCLVVGDVNSTLACAIVAKKEGIKVAHVEGGIRSGDMQMPEEINRIVTDSITDYFFTTSQIANQNLIDKGHSPDSIIFVGNTMIDSLLGNIDRLIEPKVYKEFELENSDFIVMTLHRPSNVDEMDHLKHLLLFIDNSVKDIKVVFPMHPRTKNAFDGLVLKLKNVIVTEPSPYLEFIYLIKNSIGVITDSGGITEETTVLGIPCITLRTSTERPETVTIGTNEIVGVDINMIRPYIEKMVSKKWKKGGIPPLWDGKASERIVNFLSELKIS